MIRLFIKDFENVKDLQVRERYGKLAGIVGIVSNAVLCAMKILVGMFVNSIAIIADGINNLADASSSVITLIGFRLSARPEDEGHPYGHARIEYLTGLLISALIILLGVQLLRSSAAKVMAPDPLQFSWITVIILAVAIGVKVWQACFNISLGKKINSVALTATGTDSRNDVISTSAVLLSVIAGKLFGVQLDGIMGCLVALFIIWSGIQLIRDTSSPLLGEAPDPELVNAIKERVSSFSGVLGIHDLVVHNYGPGRIFVSLHIEVDAGGNLMESHDMIDNVERALTEELKIHIVAHMDPVRVGDPLTMELAAVIEECIEPLDGVCGFHDLRIVAGPTHTNIIFDVVVTPECKIKESEIRDLISRRLQEICSTYYTVIDFDKSYTQI